VNDPRGRLQTGLVRTDNGRSALDHTSDDRPAHVTVIVTKTPRNEPDMMR
jgi:hypothetical protein